MNPWMQVTGWTLIHFVWQGGLLALAVAAGLRLCRRPSSKARYAVACAGLAAMLASPAITAVFLSAPASVLVTGGDRPRAVSASEVASMAPRASTDDVSSSTDGAAAGVAAIGLDALLPFMVWGWLAGVTLLLARFAGGCWRVHRLKIASLEEAASQWQAASERLVARLRLDVAVHVVESALVDTPTVIGWIRPVILLPVAVLTNLAPVQIEAILAHELAHIRRHDYAVNLLQTFAETLLFYHPGVWWVSARLREEREHCCDDVAVEVCGEPTMYAAALAELESCRTCETGLALAATDGSLLTRVRRVLPVPADDEPRSMSGLIMLALGLSVLVGLGALESSQAPTDPPQHPTRERRLYITDHFEIHYPPDLDLHAERVGREAERAYEKVSSDLKHDLAFRVPVILFHTTNELQQSMPDAFGQLHVASFAEPSRDRIGLAMDHPSDEWYGLIAHGVAHVFGFDIIPGTSIPQWIAEGLAEYERGAWDPSDLVALREAVLADAVPKISSVDRDGVSRNPRFIHIVGHAAFDFIESRWGKPGVRQFLLALRQAAMRGDDPFERGLRVTRDEFDQAFKRYLKEHLTASAAERSLPERFDYLRTVRIEGDIAAVNSSTLRGLACVEVWVAAEGGDKRRWALECGDEVVQDVIKALRPGDRVIVTGPPAREPATQRMIMHSLVRPSDGFTWRAHQAS